MPASRARKLSQLMSEGGSLDTQIDSSGTTSEIGSGGVTVIGSPESFPATNTATDGDMVLVTDINKLFVFNGSGWDSVSMVQNQSPAIITPISDQTFATGDSAITVQLAATDPEGLPLTWVISESDSNQNICTIQLNQSNLVNQYSTLTITPTSDINVAESSFNVTATGYDNSGNSTSDIFQVSLSSVNPVTWAVSNSDPYIAWTDTEDNTKTRFAIPANSAVGTWRYALNYPDSPNSFGNNNGEFVTVTEGVTWNGQTYSGYYMSTPWTTGNGNYEVWNDSISSPNWTNESNAYANNAGNIP